MDFELPSVSQSKSAHWAQSAVHRVILIQELMHNIASFAFTVWQPTTISIALTSRAFLEPVLDVEWHTTDTRRLMVLLHVLLDVADIRQDYKNLDDTQAARFIWYTKRIRKLHHRGPLDADTPLYLGMVNQLQTCFPILRSLRSIEIHSSAFDTLFKLYPLCSPNQLESIQLCLTVCRRGTSFGHTSSHEYDYHGHEMEVRMQTCVPTLRHLNVIWNDGTFYHPGDVPKTCYPSRLQTLFMQLCPDRNQLVEVSTNATAPMLLQLRRMKSLRNLTLRFERRASIDVDGMQFDDRLESPFPQLANLKLDLFCPCSSAIALFRHAQCIPSSSLSITFSEWTRKAMDDFANFLSCFIGATDPTLEAVGIWIGTPKAHTSGRAHPKNQLNWEVLTPLLACRELRVFRFSDLSMRSSVSYCNSSKPPLDMLMEMSRAWPRAHTLFFDREALLVLVHLYLGLHPTSWDTPSFRGDPAATDRIIIPLFHTGTAAAMSLVADAMAQFPEFIPPSKKLHWRGRSLELDIMWKELFPSCPCPEYVVLASRFGMKNLILPPYVEEVPRSCKCWYRSQEPETA